MADRSRILIVEDEAEIRLVLHRALGEHEVIEVADAEGALDLLVAGSMDLVITDIALPRMDGCALAAHLRERWPHIPVMAISGYVEGRDVAEFHFDAFLDKPLDVQHLREQVRTLLAKGAG